MEIYYKNITFSTKMQKNQFMFFNIFHKILHSSFFTLHLFLYFCP